MKLEDVKPLASKDNLLFLDQVVVVHVPAGPQLLEEGRKWASGRFPQNLGIDPPSHLAGSQGTGAQKHAHVFGRNGKEVGVVNFDGTASHSSRFKLHQRDADTLLKLNFGIRPDNIVEWVALADYERTLLLG